MTEDDEILKTAPALGDTPPREGAEEALPPEIVEKENQLMKAMGEGPGFFDEPPIDTGEDKGMSPEEERAYYEAMGAEQHKREAEILTTVQYILEPHLPDDEGLKKEFKKYEMLISKNLALANISRDSIYRYLDYFDVVILWMKFGMPQIAVKRMARLLMELQLTRSVDFGERLAQVSTRQILEQEPADKDAGEVVKKKKRFGIF